MDCVALHSVQESWQENWLTFRVLCRAMLFEGPRHLVCRLTALLPDLLKVNYCVLVVVSSVPAHMHLQSIFLTMDSHMGVQVQWLVQYLNFAGRSGDLKYHACNARQWSASYHVDAGAGADEGDIVLQTFKEQQRAYRALLDGMKVVLSHLQCTSLISNAPVAPLPAD